MVPHSLQSAAYTEDYCFSPAAFYFAPEHCTEKNKVALFLHAWKTTSLG